MKQGFKSLSETLKEAGGPLPSNVPAQDPLKRDLGCAVIQTVHQLNAEQDFRSFDSVRGVFPEGEQLYPRAGVREKNHIQICVRNLNCIKGFFEPRKLDPAYPCPNAG